MAEFAFINDAIILLLDNQTVIPIFSKRHHSFQVTSLKDWP